MRNKVILALLIFVAYPAASEAFGQSCRPAVLGYFVRDAKGNYLTEQELKAISASMPQLSVEQVAFAPDGTLVGYSTKKTKLQRAALSQANAASCQLKIGEMILRHNGMKMRLIFDLEINRRDYYFDSLRFQNGTFKLDQETLPASGSDEVIPSKVWRKISNKP